MDCASDIRTEPSLGVGRSVCDAAFAGFAIEPASSGVFVAVGNVSTLAIAAAAITAPVNFSKTASARYELPLGARCNTLPKATPMAVARKPHSPANHRNPKCQLANEPLVRANETLLRARAVPTEKACGVDRESPGSAESCDIRIP